MVQREDEQFIAASCSNVSKGRLLRKPSKKYSREGSQIEPSRVRSFNLNHDRASILSREKVSLIRLYPLRSMLSKYPTSIKEKMVHNVQSSSKNQYQVLWKRFAEFVFKRY